MTRPEQDTAAQGKTAGERGGRYLTVFLVLFGLFTLNVLLGKAGIQFGWDVPFLLGDVAEFLLLLVAAVFLMLAALRRERDRPGDNT
jgi:heme A synthase